MVRRSDVDVVIANGHIYPQVDHSPELNEDYRQLPFLLRNDGARLVDVSREAGPGFQVAASARGASAKTEIGMTRATSAATMPANLVVRRTANGRDTSNSPEWLRAAWSAHPY